MAMQIKLLSSGEVTPCSLVVGPNVSYLHLQGRRREVVVQGDARQKNVATIY